MSTDVNMWLFELQYNVKFTRFLIEKNMYEVVDVS